MNELDKVVLQNKRTIIMIGSLLIYVVYLLIIDYYLFMNGFVFLTTIAFFGNLLIAYVIIIYLGFKFEIFRKIEKILNEVK